MPPAGPARAKPPAEKQGREAAAQRAEGERRQAPARPALEALLRGDEPGSYASHTTWESRAAFEAWTKSEAFRKAHGQSPMPKGLIQGHPRLQLYEAILAEETL